MKHVLLLHDTQELDLARDFKELIEELGVQVELIVPGPDRASTLQDKEDEYFAKADAAVFLLTPGSVRTADGEPVASGAAFPSPSVTHEMGQAKVHFKQGPGVVVYLVDQACKLPAVDQKPYVSFKRDDMRSIVQAATKLIRNLKAGGVVLPTEKEAQVEAQSKPSPGINIVDVAGKVQDRLKRITDDMAGKPNGMYELGALNKLLAEKYRLDQKAINFVLGDLQSLGLATYYPQTPTQFYSFVGLTSLGWQLVRHEDEKRKEAASRAFIDTTLTEYIAKLWKEQKE